MIIDDILEEIKKADKIVILTHETPDGDAVGSALAMKHAIAQIGKKVDVIIPEFSDCFKFLPGTNEIIKDSKVEKYDLAIAVDCADYKILKGFDPYFEKAKVKIVIDHHGSNKMYGDINFVNPVAPACCQILVGMFEYLGVNIDKKISLKDSIKAPISKGDVIGNVEFTLYDQTIATTPIISDTDVPKLNLITMSTSVLKNWFKLLR